MEVVAGRKDNATGFSFFLVIGDHPSTFKNLGFNALFQVLTVQQSLSSAKLLIHYASYALQSYTQLHTTSCLTMVFPNKNKQ